MALLASSNTNQLLNKFNSPCCGLGSNKVIAASCSMLLIVHCLQCTACIVYTLVITQT